VNYRSYELAMAKSQDEHSAYFRQVLHNLPCPACYFLWQHNVFPTTWGYKLDTVFMCMNMCTVKAWELL